ncbi:MAG: hypothetical protein CBC96_00535 [Pelagibacteraceae bacterium TMED136]|nr:MAG: hypothetical protein CBC96_00535 [Pelagibacteraceae bacterium TMED136]|tara:strand:- start:105 stop:671 length:567 start_codon:yes stop_codon:yes gene_type:complete
MSFWTKFLIILLYTNISFASITDEIIKKLKGTANITFNFKQVSNKQNEKGQCLIVFPGNLKCIYKSEDGKEIVVKNKSLYIIKHKFKRSYRYPIENSAFNIILNKEKIFEYLKAVKTSDIKETSDEYFYEINATEGIYIKIFFNKNTKMLNGWETISYNQQPVKFYIVDPIVVNSILKEKFILPNYNY